MIKGSKRGYTNTPFRSHQGLILSWTRAKGFPGEFTDSVTNYFKSKSGLSTGTLFDHINATVNTLGFSGTLQDKLNAFFVFKTGIANPLDAENAFWSDSSLDFATLVPAALVSSVADSGETDSTVTTAGINTTGATLLVAMISSAGTSPTVSDSKGNTWTALTVRTAPSGTKGQLYYVANPTVGTGHTFTAAAASSFPAIAVLAFSGVKTTSPFDQQNGSSGAQPGSITPTENNEVVVSGLHNTSISAEPSINGGFTVGAFSLHAGGVSYGVGIAYLIQTTAAAANPTWTAAGGDYATTIASFKNAT